MLVFSCVLLLATGANAQSRTGGIPLVHNFHTVEYKAGIQNWDIAQDRRGLIYVANNFGLLEYDGNVWHIYGVTNGTKIRSVAIDPRGRIYVGCQADFGYFFPNKSGQLVYTSLANQLPKEVRDIDETWNVYIDNEQVFFCTFSNVYIYNGKTITIAETPKAISQCFLINRQLYVSEPGDGINILDGNSLTPVKGGSFFASLNVSSILQLHSDQLVVATALHGIYLLTNEGVKPLNPELQPLFSKARVNCMIRLANGNFAVGTQNEGLLLISSDGKLITQLTRGKGLENRTVLSIYEDDLHNIWIGHNNGLAYVELGSPFTFINEQAGLPGTGYSAYLDDDKLYLGTNTGLYLRGGRQGEFKLINNTGGQVYHVARYGNDLLVGHHNGALRVEGLTATPISREQGSWIFLPLRDQPDKLMEGTYKGLNFYRRVQGHWRFEKKLRGLEESSRVMAQNKSDEFWVTHGYKGAFKVTLNDRRDSILRVSYYGSEKGFPTNQLINVFNVRNDLIFTADHGIYRYDEQKNAFIPNELFSKLLGANAQLWYLQEDALGNIYFIGREQIGVLRKNSIGEYLLESNTFNRIRKFLNDDLENITILKNNEVLFGAKDGFIHYDPAMRAERKSAFHTLIRRVSLTNAGDSAIFHGNYIVNDSITDIQPANYKSEIPYKNNSVRFAFAATSYEGDAELLYQYYLDAYEKNWSDWNATTQKEYTNLKEGHYTFHVRAKNVNGEISADEVYEFTIKAPWYRSFWAYTFYGASVMGLLFVGFNMLDKKYQREQKRMALRQEKELNQKENEISKISQQSQEEITRLQNEKLESELQHMNNELATSTMHLLNKNEFISGIRTNLVQIIKKSTNEEVKRELNQINRDIENNISADADWEQFQFHFDRVHGDFSSRFKTAFPSLSPQEIKLSAYLRMNLSTKEIAQLLNISVRGVEISRYRLRKKLALDRTRNLQDFILNF